jgi:hypothetical protein
VGEKDSRIRVPPPPVRGWEVLADVAVADGAEQSISQSVQTSVGVGVTDQSLEVGNPHAAARI